MSKNVLRITDQQKEQYREEGYCILENVVPENDLKMLREKCSLFMYQMDTEMEQKGTDVLGITHKGKRYFIGGKYKESEDLRRFLFRDYMADICRATIGQDAYLFVEQYVVKAAEKGMKFGWHQDSGYVGHDHKPYLTCWCALDDMTEANGTVFILPYSHAGTRQRVEHEREEGTNDKIGYHGDDPGIPVMISAGSMAVFSSTTFHRSGVNSTDKMRRTYLAQYSAEPIMNQDGTKLWGNAVPFLKDGKRIDEFAANDI
ncbi:MAG: phytanoyl-CoA dioxygenase family protein [Abditibacteriaceae bacterium]